MTHASTISGTSLKDVATRHGATGLRGRRKRGGKRAIIGRALAGMLWFIGVPHTIPGKGALTAACNGHACCWQRSAGGSKTL